MNKILIALMMSAMSIPLAQGKNHITHSAREMGSSPQPHMYSKKLQEAADTFQEHLGVTISFMEDTRTYYENRKTQFSQIKSLLDLDNLMSTITPEERKSLGYDEVRKELMHQNATVRTLTTALYAKNFSDHYAEKCSITDQSLNFYSITKNALSGHEPIDLLFQSYLTTYGITIASRWDNITGSNYPVFSFCMEEYQKEKNLDSIAKIHGTENRVMTLLKFFKLFYPFVSGNPDIKQHVQYTPALKMYLDGKIKPTHHELYCLDGCIKYTHGFLFPKGILSQETRLIHPFTKKQHYLSSPLLRLHLLRISPL